YMSPYLVRHPSDDDIKSVLASALFAQSQIVGTTATLDDQEFQTVAVQLKALGFVNIKYSKTVQGGMGVFWSLTSAGERLMMQLRTVRTNLPIEKSPTSIMSCEDSPI
ncbi:MAG: hypothetical protein M3Z36_13495, partial [Acidobacteriota bacterium]|nr:hypothetical protein [Acidobacteriota bacterium]